MNIILNINLFRHAEVGINEAQASRLTVSNAKTIKLNGTRKTFKYGIMFGLRPINRKLRQFGEA